MTIKDIEFKLKDGRTAILRSANEKDAKALIEYMKKSTSETDFLLRTPEECETQTIEQEIDFINSCNSSDTQALLVCEAGGKIAGNCMVWWNNRVKTGHKASVAIGLLSEFWNQGIGTKMFREMIKIAENNPKIMQMELDFIEGKETAALVEKYGFPEDKLLFAGVVNGKNIWRNHYQKTLDLLEGLQAKNISVVISTSCSLLHVPYTLQNEGKLPENVGKHFAFALEKLQELEELKALAEGKESDTLQENTRLFAQTRDCGDPAVQKRVSKIKEEDFTRLPAFEEREKIQKERFSLPLFPTTTIGSFPQTADVKATRTAYRKKEISEEEYVAFNRKKIAECVALQEEIGLDVLVHGEYERNDMVEYFGENLKGYLFTEKAWVQSYGTRCVKPPIIWGDISREKAMTVAWSVYAQSLTEKPMKGMLTGPVTILNWSFPREDISLKESAYQIALAIRDEVLDLEKNGIAVIQVDEAALREKLPLRRSDWYTEYLDWAIRAFRLVHSGAKAETQIHTHMCYSEFTDIIPAIDQMDADVITFEASRSDLTILDSLQENNFRTEVGPGVYDIHSPRIPSEEEIVEALRKMTQKVKVEKLWVNPDCGLKTRGTKETKPSLCNMVLAAKKLREEQVNG